MNPSKKEFARFDARLSREQKEFFERAALLGGYRSLTDFVVSAVQKRANEIIEQKEKILADERDREIFFNALLNPPEPNEYLKEASEAYLKKHGK